LDAKDRLGNDLIMIDTIKGNSSALVAYQETNDDDNP